jgi:hypothetical protein
MHYLIKYEIPIGRKQGNKQVFVGVLDSSSGF